MSQFSWVFILTMIFAAILRESPGIAIALAVVTAIYFHCRQPQ